MASTTPEEMISKNKKLLKNIYIINSVVDTKKLAEEFMKQLLTSQGKASRSKEAVVVGLSGELGAGKTAFTQEIGKILGVKSKINSPTFVIMKRYELINKIFKNLIHIDAYRLKNEKELLHLGWKEIISNPQNLVFIEWPENVKKAIPKKYHKILISHTKEGYRKFVFKMV